MDIASLRKKHRAMLAKQGVLDRPWLIFGAAPDPTLPANIDPGTVLLCLNNAGATAAKLGLPPADITMRAWKKEWESVRGIKMPLMLWLTDKSWRRVTYERLWLPRQVKKVRPLMRSERAAINDHVLGTEIAEVGIERKPSNGIFAIAYAIFLDVPKITFCGISTQKTGHSYNAADAPRRHIDEDLYALQHIARAYPHVYTSEPDMSEAAGLPLAR